jgi:hypothetical protein
LRRDRPPVGRQYSLYRAAPPPPSRRRGPRCHNPDWLRDSRYPWSKPTHMTAALPAPCRFRRRRRRPLLLWMAAAAA